jgi:phosphomevalonate kinase
VRAIAPGKLVLTGAYAVLDGAPATVAAVDRYAVADASRLTDAIIPEIRAAFVGRAAPATDVSALQDARGRKLGLGSSAAAVVASLAADALLRGEDLAAPAVRAGIFGKARDAHARVQSGGSGIDVAASVYGGVLRYAVTPEGPVIRAVALPPGIVLAAFFSGVIARTSELRARVEAKRKERPDAFAALGTSMAHAATDAADALECADAAAFVSLAATYGTLLAELGRLSDALIVAPAVAELGALADRYTAAFLPSGAGGGDVAVWIGPAPPPRAFVLRAEALALTSLPLSVDLGGVRPESLHP